MDIWFIFIIMSIYEVCSKSSLTSLVEVLDKPTVLV